MKIKSPSIIKASLSIIVILALTSIIFFSTTNIGCGCVTLLPGRSMDGYFHYNRPQFFYDGQGNSYFSFMSFESEGKRFSVANQTGKWIPTNQLIHIDPMSGRKDLLVVQNFEVVSSESID